MAKLVDVTTLKIYQSRGQEMFEKLRDNCKAYVSTSEAEIESMRGLLNDYLGRNKLKDDYKPVRRIAKDIDGKTVYTIKLVKLTQDLHKDD
jgi:hypothetical protein